MEHQQSVQPDSAHWKQAPVAELVDFIVNRFHSGHREQLPELIRDARRVEYVHAGQPRCPVGLTEALEDFYQELESHMTKEERVLFPLLVVGRERDARMPISVMRFEHAYHADSLKAIQDLTGGVEPPAHACATWRRLYTNLQRFSQELGRHIQLENEVLFFNASQEAEGAHDA
ncbi:hemerythrin domain-containing protein [Pusillimonas sp. ANT_WB101]|uniref:hemerythrin domain-containing protein n=1 Tax=Pusillimonas sp. ANT_WB101 TaxID=2597356 RepID=UPI0011EC8195|nr:hemerythrin domain-containing protein [Pusillimonas sp. ANT_WB101]KAA0910719.1 hypothetical protein FQ179_02250 [Pusillimonas sp. ANT_WB101]